jgi:putative transcription factor
MSNCELCGRKPGKFEAEIEGTVMKVCEDCSKYGKVRAKSNVKIIYEEKKKADIPELEYNFIPGFGSVVKNARERLKLKQEEMAKKLNVRESLLHQIESEHFKPGYDLAKKLEKELHIKIIEEIKNGEIKSDVNLNKQKSGSGSMTLGDMMRKR